MQQCEQTLKGVAGVLVVNEELAIDLQELSKLINSKILPVPALADQADPRRSGRRVSKKEFCHDTEVAAASALVPPTASAIRHCPPPPR